MAVIQISDKSIRISPGLDRNKTQELVFANQLLQIPGVTEKLAVALSKRFQSAVALMEYLRGGNSLKDFTFEDSRQATKKYVLESLSVILLRINSRLLSVLERIFEPRADPHLCIW